MRKISQRYGVVLLLLICFSGGYSSSFFKPHSEASAALAKVPRSCFRYKCIGVAAVWTSGSKIAGAFFDDEGDSIRYAWTDLYGVASFEDLPIAPKKPNTPVTLKTYTACAPTCGYDPGTTNWQAAQEVSIPPGTKQWLPPLPYGNQQECFQAGGFESFTPNDNTAIPPGWEPDIIQLPPRLERLTNFRNQLLFV